MKLPFRKLYCLAFLLVLAACASEPTPTPDLVATQIAVEKAAHATMTAEAPTATNTPVPTETPEPTSTDTVTPTPTDTNTPTSTPTCTPSPTDTPTDTPTPTLTPSPVPSSTPMPTAKPKPTQAPTTEPKPQKPALSTYMVYYSSFDGYTSADMQHAVNYSVWSMRGDGQEAAMMFNGAQEPALSNDGTKLAYVRLEAGIFVLDLTTGEHRHVVNHNNAYSPSFSPGDYRLCYTEYTVARWWQIFSANSQVHIANADGSGDTTALVGRRPAWSPTDNLILYEACEGTTCGILILNADNGSTRLLIGESAGKASWSPDGKKITYSTNADGDSEIWVIDLDGTGKKKLTDNMSTDALASWTPDGQFIYFLSDRQDGWGIWVMNPDGTNQRKVKSIGVGEYWQWAKMSVGWNK